MLAAGNFEVRVDELLPISSTMLDKRMVCWNYYTIDCL